MDKLAVFVEGQTDQIFVEELIYQIAGRQDVHIDCVTAFGGGPAGERAFLEVQATQRPDPNKKFYVIIYNSAGYERVLSDVREHYQNLASQNYKLIIALRDVKPQTQADIPTIRADFTTFLPQRPIYPLLVLAIMELEAWFIAESSHFPKIHASLTPAVVAARLGYDPATSDLEQRLDPVGDLRRVYTVGGYNKSRRHAERTVNVIDYGAVYFTLKERFADLTNLIAYLNGFFS
jgi:hypothetical protein